MALLRLAQVLLNEPRTEMDVDLNERFVTNAVKAVDLSRLYDENVTRAGLELLAVDRPETAAFSHELDFVVRMTMRARTTAGEGSKEEYGDIHVAIVGANELVRAALEGQILLANAIHPTDAPVVNLRGFRNAGKDRYPTLSQ
jgi:hypothetical protein